MEVFRAVPQVKKITIEVVDDEKLDINDLAPGDTLAEEYSLPTKRVAFIGYVKGGGTPVPVEIGVNRIHAEYDDNYPSGEEIADMTTNQQYYRMKRANDLLRRDWLCEVVRGLDAEVADSLILTAPGQRYSDGERILMALGWMDEPVPMPKSDDNEEATEDKGEVQTVVTGN